MRRAHQEMTDAGLSLVMVGMGTPAQTADFVRAMELPYPVLSDPDREAYRAYGLIEAGPREFLNPSSGKAFVRSMFSGAGGGKVVGNPQQIGGAFVIDRGGKVLLSHPSAFPGDHATPEELLGALAACKDFCR